MAHTCHDQIAMLIYKQAAAAAARKGEAPPPGEEAFDSNCITPGTAFMARLGDHLRFFIRHKMASDPVWQRPRIVFSGERRRAAVPMPMCSSP